MVFKRPSQVSLSTGSRPHDGITKNVKLKNRAAARTAVPGSAAVPGGTAATKCATEAKGTTSFKRTKGRQVGTNASTKLPRVNSQPHPGHPLGVSLPFSAGSTTDHTAEPTHTAAPHAVPSITDECTAISHEDAGVIAVTVRQKKNERRKRKAPDSDSGPIPVSSPLQTINRVAGGTDTSKRIKKERSYPNSKKIPTSFYKKLCGGLKARCSAEDQRYIMECALRATQPHMSDLEIVDCLPHQRCFLPAANEEEANLSLPLKLQNIVKEAAIKRVTKSILVLVQSRARAYEVSMDIANWPVLEDSAEPSADAKVIASGGGGNKKTQLSDQLTILKRLCINARPPSTETPTAPTGTASVLVATPARLLTILKADPDTAKRYFENISVIAVDLALSPIQASLLQMADTRDTVVKLYQDHLMCDNIKTTLAWIFW